MEKMAQLDPHLQAGEVFKGVQDRLATTERFEHQARLRPVSERPIWVCLSAQSILGGSPKYNCECAFLLLCLV